MSSSHPILAPYHPSVSPFTSPPRSQMGTSQCRTTTERAPLPPHASRPPSRAAFPPVPSPRLVSLVSDSTSRLPCAKPTAPTQLGEGATHDTHVPVINNPADITVKKDPLNSRARSAVGRFSTRSWPRVWCSCSSRFVRWRDRSHHVRHAIFGETTPRIFGETAHAIFAKKTHGRTSTSGSSPSPPAAAPGNAEGRIAARCVAAEK